jgi:predicted Fe-Mo cluster-binding NifX family protein
MNPFWSSKKPSLAFEVFETPILWGIAKNKVNRYMKTRILIPLFNDYVAPRFDLATEVLITDVEDSGHYKEKIVMLPNASAEQLCHMILVERIQVLICGGIEEEYYQYLKWKKIVIRDAVIGKWQSVLARFSSEQSRLRP